MAKANGGMVANLLQSNRKIELENEMMLGVVVGMCWWRA
jgi:hypothetical protein